MPIGSEKFDLVALLHASVQDAVIGDDAAERIVDAVENHRLQRGFWISFWRRDPFYDGFQNVFHPESGLSAGWDDVVHGTSDEVHDLITHHLWIGRVQIHFIEDGDDFKVVLQGQIKIRNRLSLNALRRIYDQQSPLTCCDGPGYLVAEVHVPRSIDQIEDKLLSIFGLVGHLDSVAFDGNSPLPFEVHIVQCLVLHLALSNGSSGLEQAIGQGAFPVVDVGNDAEISDVIHRKGLRHKINAECPLSLRLGFGYFMGSSDVLYLPTLQSAVLWKTRAAERGA